MAFDLFSAFKGKRILVTGHTGFKGSWLVSWLTAIGAEVVGVSLQDAPTEPSHFEEAGLKDKITDRRLDICNFEKLNKAVSEIRPEIVFHLAAQSLVRHSYSAPIETFHTNVIGTAHILECLRQLAHPCTAVIITSDKCYANVEWTWGYRENDRLGGYDPYSASKSAAEMIVKSYVESFFPKGGSIRIGIARAGNVIGGGDWAEDRVVPDCFRCWAKNKDVEIRSPEATRPWQHVLEPLGGYLTLALALVESDKLHGEPFNFGPVSDQNCSVKELVSGLANYWHQASWKDVSENPGDKYESGLLKLNCDKALHQLDWRPTLFLDETIQLTAEWYKHFYAGDKSVADVTTAQIAEYDRLTKERRRKKNFQ